jgi:hypothetical protein
MWLRLRGDGARYASRKFSLSAATRILLRVQLGPYLRRRGLALVDCDVTAADGEIDDHVAAADIAGARIGHAARLPKQSCGQL